jgi:uncharacterized MnhB-related membrane protein
MPITIFDFMGQDFTLVAMILSVMSSILHYMTKNLIAPVIANTLFTVCCSGIALYHRLM